MYCFLDANSRTAYEYTNRWCIDCRLVVNIKVNSFKYTVYWVNTTIYGIKFPIANCYEEVMAGFNYAHKITYL